MLANGDPRGISERGASFPVSGGNVTNCGVPDFAEKFWWISRLLEINALHPHRERRNEGKELTVEYRPRPRRSITGLIGANLLVNDVSDAS